MNAIIFLLGCIMTCYLWGVSRNVDRLSLIVVTTSLLTGKGSTELTRMSRFGARSDSMSLCRSTDTGQGDTIETWHQVRLDISLPDLSSQKHMDPPPADNIFESLLHLFLTVGCWTGFLDLCYTAYVNQVPSSELFALVNESYLSFVCVWLRMGNSTWHFTETFQTHTRRSSGSNWSWYTTRLTFTTPFEDVLQLSTSHQDAASDASIENALKPSSLLGTLRSRLCGDIKM